MLNLKLVSNQKLLHPNRFTDSFTKKNFTDRRKVIRDDNVLTASVIGLIRTSRYSFIKNGGIGSTSPEALYENVSNSQLSVSVRGSNVSMMNTKESSTNGIPCDMVLEGNPSCLFNLLTDDVIKTMIHIYFSELIIFGNTV